MNPATYTIKYGDTLSSIARNAGVSVQELQALNPTITDPNKIYAGRSITTKSGAPAPAPAPVVAPTVTPTAPVVPTKPTIADVASNVVIPDYVGDPTMDALGSGYKDTATTKLDEAEIRRQARERIQANIDAVNQIYNQKRAEAQVQGQARTGSTTAINARSGLIGSDFGTANTNTTEKYNTDILDSIDSERNAKIQALLTESDKDATSLIAEKRAAIEQGATKYLEYLSTTDAKKKAAVSSIAKSLIAQGINPDNLSADQIAKLSKNYGMTADEFRALYTDLKTKSDEDKAKTEKTIADAEKAKGGVNQFELSDGQQKYVYDPKTGKAELVASNVKEFAPNKYSGGGTGGAKGTGSGSPAVGKDGKFLDYYDPNFTLTSVRNSKGGRFLTQGELKPITDIQQVVGQADNLTSLIRTVDTGPFLGIIKSNNPYDTKAQAMKAAITAIVPKLARGVYGEVGVLTDQDIANYSKTIANLKSTNDVNKAVMAMTLDIATRSLSNQLNSLSAGGRDVSKFEPIYSGMESKAKELKTSIGYGTAPADTASTAGPTVKVKNPTTGQVITIPQANLSKALSKGYVQQ